MAVIWLVEDEATIADSLIYKLESEHYQIRWFERGLPLLDALTQSVHTPDLILLDVGLPDISGFDLAKQLMASYDIPFIFLTARNEEIDKIVGLELGADDYIAKPFSPREVLARIKALLRRVTKQQQVTVTNKGPFFFDEECAYISYFNQVLNLTRYEYLLLKTLLNSPNRIFSRTQLMDLVWQDNLNSMERTIDTHIKTLRQKLTSVNQDLNPIQTHRGLGYSVSIPMD